jgi:hypothetical protein
MYDSIPSANAGQRAAQVRATARRRQRRAKIVSYVSAWIVAAVIATLIGVAIHAYASSTRQVTVTVTNEARVCSNDGNSVSCQYLVYTSGGTFKDTDSLISGKFSSSDLYGQLVNGRTYTFEVRGYRIPFMSEYPNILRIVSAGSAK